MSDSVPTGEAPGSRPWPRAAEPDAHGQAALLLAESILHAMVETRALTVAQAIGVVRTTCEVKIDVAGETHESAGRMRKSLELLQAIERSLVVDDADAAPR